jgi:hypothetical protein
MKRLMMITAAVLAFAGAAHGLEDIVKEQTYRLNGKPAQMWTDAQMDVEMRFIPGWQLDPNCPQVRWGDEECNGGQGFLFFIGINSGEATLHGQARTDRCPEWFDAFVDLNGKGDRLTIRQVNAKGAVVRNSKCNVVLQPAKDPRR